MSNVKAINISGDIPFDAGGNADLIRLIGHVHLPSVGTRIEYGGVSRMEPNEHGGETTMYWFCLHGSEAVPWGFLEEFKRLVELVGGRIDDDSTIDIEA